MLLLGGLRGSRYMGEYIRVEGVSKVYEVRGNKLIAIDDVSFSVVKPEFIAILGPNGAGKTTLLNIIATVLPPSKGKVYVKGIDVWREPWRAKRLIGFVPQEYGVYENLNVVENLWLVCEIYRIPRNEARRRGRELIELFGLEEHRRKLAGKLSGGLKRRLSIAMSLLHDPEILVLDEPTTGLDPGIRRELIEFLRDMISKGRVVLMSTHIAGEAELSDRVIVMYRGKIIADDDPGELKRKTVGLKTIVELDIYPSSKLDEVVKTLSTRWHASKKGSSVIVTVERFEREVVEIIDVAKYCNVNVLEVRVRPPGLDDVFLKLTGCKLGE